MRNRINLSGKRFGRLTIINRHNIDGSHGHSMWVCLCDCGNKTIKNGSGILRGDVKSCGCLAKENSSYIGKITGGSRKLKEGEAGFNRLFRQYKYNAKRRNIEFSLSKDEFKKITKGVCFYTGKKPSHKIGDGNGRGNGLYVYNGVDRIDSNKGYTKENCVPCCGKVNRMKMDLCFYEFISLCREISEKHGL